MACCGPEEDANKAGVVTQGRKCRDIYCVFLFLAFWGGMIYICVKSFQDGDINKLIYGSDSYGMTCGTVNTLGGNSYNLTLETEVYYLNYLELLDVDNIQYAKKVCIQSCPSTDDSCNGTTLPSNNGSQFTCPYYRFAQNYLYNHLPGVDNMSTNYYDNLASIKIPRTTLIDSSVQAISSLGPSWSDLIDSMGLTGNSPEVSGQYYQLMSQFPGVGPCFPITVPTFQYFHRCWPDYPSQYLDYLVKYDSGALSSVASTEFENAISSFDSWGETWSRSVGDLSKGVLIIISAGPVCGLFFATMWMVIMRYFTGFITWFTIVLVNLMMIIITLLCFYMAGKLGSYSFLNTAIDDLPGSENPANANQDAWLYAGIAMAVVSALVLLICILMFSRINIAIDIIEVAAQALAASPATMIVPVIPFILVVALVLYAVTVTALMYSSGSYGVNCRLPSDLVPFTFSNLLNSETESLLYGIGAALNTPPPPGNYSNSNCYADLSQDDAIEACASDPSCYVSLNWDDTLMYMLIYHVFGFLWTLQVIIGLGSVSTAGSVSAYYYASGDDSKLATCNACTFFLYAFTTSLGSVCFAAFLIAVFMLVRYILEILDRNTACVQDGNSCVKWLMGCAVCCAICMQKLVQFISSNAYILMGAKGTSFCTSAITAVKLFVGNSLQITAVNTVGDVILFLGKLAVAAACGGVAFGLTKLPYYDNEDTYPDTFLSSGVLCVVMCVLIGFVIATVFFAVYEMAIDTIMLCYCDDCANHGGHPQFAPKLLMQALGNVPANKPKDNKVVPEGPGVKMEGAVAPGHPAGPGPVPHEGVRSEPPPMQPGMTHGPEVHPHPGMPPAPHEQAPPPPPAAGGPHPAMAQPTPGPAHALEPLPQQHYPTVPS